MSPSTRANPDPRTLCRGISASPGYARSLVNAATSRLGRLDIVVNNAAFQMERERIEDVSPEELERTFRTNVFGTFYLTQAALASEEASYVSGEIYGATGGRMPL